MKTTHKFAIGSALGMGLISAVALSGPGGMGMGMSGGCGDYGSGGHHGMMGGNMQQRAEMMQQRHGERMELLKYRLELTPEQETAWEDFIQAQNAHHETMGQRPQQGDQQGQASFADHLDNRIQFMEQRLSGMKEVAQAADELYTQLNPEQQQIMDDFVANRPGAKRLSKTQ